MNISQTITWPSVNWPTSVGPASQYTIYQAYPGPVTALQNVATTSATLTYDDSANLAFQIRPTSGPLGALTGVGPEVSVFVVNYVPCRAWLRQKIRIAIADRVDTPGAIPNWPDDEINTYITEGIGELNVLFPIEEETTINLLSPTTDSHGNVAGVRDYALPTDFYLVRSIEYVTPDGKLHLWLKEKPFRGGESTATSYLGYPKLGIMLSPLAGRFYPGHYDVYEGQVHIDWDAVGDGDYLHIRYLGRRAAPVNDADVITATPEDLELVSLYTQLKCWLRIESSDTSLSRWRTRDDGSRRDDMPTIRQSTLIRSIYNERIKDRKELRPKTRRLVRR